MATLKEFIGGRIKSVNYAVKGAYLLASSEHSIISQLTVGALVTVAGFYFEISKTEWMFQIFSIGLIVTAEGLNTAAEKIADFIQPNFDPKIGFIKDIAAGAVFFAALTAMIIGAIIYVPKFI
ncbi:MAG: diacylglycerol kinase family protein [Flavobacterium sp.]|nr:diacylglycerol kinase family protein [Candidatus Neoflavobacterium equi]